MCPPIAYKSLPYVLAVIALFDMALGIIRIYIYFSPKSSVDPQHFLDFVRYTFKDEVGSPLLYSSQSQAAFALDWISSVVPTLMGVYIVIFAIVSLLSCCAICNCVTEVAKEENPDFEPCGSCCVVMCCMCMNKPNHRCISLSWNCPCYKARPRLRFQVRFLMVGFFILLRVIAVILYATDRTVRGYGRQMAAICGISLGLLVIVILIDYYQYRMWWNYRPAGAYRPLQSFLCLRQDFHPTLRRFIPMPLSGKFRSENTMGDRPCRNSQAGGCPDRSLEHIAIFHAFDFKPLQRFQLDRDETYIGFHQTTSEAAAKIAKTGFRISDRPPQMLGFGVYFARSFNDTGGKARAKGECTIHEQSFLFKYLSIASRFFYRGKS